MSNEPQNDSSTINAICMIAITLGIFLTFGGALSQPQNHLVAAIGTVLLGGGLFTFIVNRILKS